MEYFEKLLPLAVTLLTAIIGAAGVMLQEWRQKRDARYRRNRARAEATEMIAFIEKWIATQKMACSEVEFEQVKQTAHQQLKHIYTSVVAIEEAAPSIENESFFQRLLLLYKPVSLGGYVLHVLFYLFLIPALLFIAFGAILIPDALHDPSAPSIPMLVFIIFFTSLALLVPALAIRAWAVNVDKKDQKKTFEELPSTQLVVSQA